MHVLRVVGDLKKNDEKTRLRRSRFSCSPRCALAIFNIRRSSRITTFQNYNILNISCCCLWLDRCQADGLGFDLVGRGRLDVPAYPAAVPYEEVGEAEEDGDSVDAKNGSASCLR